MRILFFLVHSCWSHKCTIDEISWQILLFCFSHVTPYEVDCEMKQNPTKQRRGKKLQSYIHILQQ